MQRLIFMPWAISLLILLPAPLHAGSFRTDVITKPPLPDVSAGAGTRFADPTFGSRMMRLTDHNTLVGSDSYYLNRSYGTGSSSESNTWSALSNRLLIGMDGGWILPFEFDAATMTATRVDAASGPYGGRVITNMGSEMSMSYSDNDVLYGYSGMTARMMRWGVWTPIDLKDFTGLVPDGSALGGISAGINERICVYGNQDSTHWVAWFDRDSPETVHILNTATSQIDGVSIGITINKAVHNAKMAKDGRFISITLVAGGMIIWDTVANTVSPPLIYGSGHKVGGMGYFINGDDMPGAVQFQILRRPMTALHQVTPLLPRHGAPYTIIADMHPSWNNSQASSFKPVYMAAYSPTNPEPLQPYMGEIIGVYTDGSQLVERFAHHRSIYSSFDDSPRGNVSPNGRFYAFTSNWEKSLGTSTYGTKRQDVFIVEVRPSRDTLSVCPSGCDFTTAQAAIDASSPGNTIELKAGQIFAAIDLGRRRDLTIRSSRWSELPPAGTRIQPATHAPLLATISSSAAAPAALIASWPMRIAHNGVDTSANTITFEPVPDTSRFRNGDAIVCRQMGLTNSPFPLPAPLQEGPRAITPSTGQVYYIRDWNDLTATAKLALSPAGTPIDITSVGAAADPNPNNRPVCILRDAPSSIRFIGIRFLSSDVNNVAVQIGQGVETDPLRYGPAGIHLDRVVISGEQNTSGPRTCLLAPAAAHLTISDSWIGHCKSPAAESSAISLTGIAAATIRNNFISGASYSLLAGGPDTATLDVNQDLLITGNLFEKPGTMMYKEGPGAPTGECYFGGGSGAFYRRTDVSPNTCQNGACYSCQPNYSWTLDPAALYRNSDYREKSLLELRDCRNCRIEGNLFRGSFAGPESKHGHCLGIHVTSGPSLLASSYHHAHNIAIRNNWGDYCYAGIYATNATSGGIGFDRTPLKNITIENNVLTNLGWFPALTRSSDPDSPPRVGLELSTGIDGLRLANNTLRARSSIGIGMWWYAAHFPPGFANSFLENNLLPYSGSLFLKPDGLTTSCASGGLFDWIPNDGAPRIRHNLFYGGNTNDNWLNSGNCPSSIASNNLLAPTDTAVAFVASANPRLATTSPYSATNSSPLLTATDGADLGADIDLVEQFSKPAESGLTPLPDQLAVSVTPGSSAALLTFRSPDNTPCEVSLFNGSLRTPANLHADTNSPSNRQANRPSSVVAASNFQFLAGAVAPLSPLSSFSYRISCGSRLAIGKFRTRALGEQPPRLTQRWRHPSAHSVLIETATDRSFASPVTAASTVFTKGEANLTFAISSGYRYWRWRLLNAGGSTIETGAIRLAVAP